MRARVLLFLLFLLFPLLPPLLPAHAEGVEVKASSLILVRIVPPWDMIDPGVAECVVEALNYAESRRQPVLIELETYGGYLDAAFTIGDRVASSKVPVLFFVSGGKAFSAGTLIMLPAHFIALSPIATIGAMQPVAVNPLTGQYEPVNESKIINPIKEKAMYYARLRNRNTTAVELFITKNLVLTGEEAVRYGVVDAVASSVYEVLRLVSKRVFTVSEIDYVLLENLGLEEYSCSIRSRFISLLSNTILSSVLTTIGIMATIFAVASGRLEALPLALVFLVLGLVGSGFNPNLVSLFLIILGVALLSIELFLTPGFGVLGVSGIIMLATGFALLPAGGPTYIAPGATIVAISRYIALGIGIGLGGFTAFVLFKVIQAKKRKVTLFELVGKVGRAIDHIPMGGEGFVIVEGEYWKAYSDEEIEPNSLVVVVGRRDSVLIVKKYVGSS